MHDLIIVKKLNKKKLIALIIVIILIIIALTTGGVKLAKQYKKKQYAKQLKAQEEIERQIALEQQQ